MASFKLNLHDASPTNPMSEPQQELQEVEQVFARAATILMRYFGRTYSDLTRLLLRSAFSEGVVHHASTKPNSTSR